MVAHHRREPGCYVKVRLRRDLGRVSATTRSCWRLERQCPRKNSCRQPCMAKAVMSSWKQDQTAGKFCISDQAGVNLDELNCVSTCAVIPVHVNGSEPHFLVIPRQPFAAPPQPARCQSSLQQAGRRVTRTQACAARVHAHTDTHTGGINTD